MEGESSTGQGRARGRARGRSRLAMGQPGVEGLGPGGNGNGSNGNNGNGTPSGNGNGNGNGSPSARGAPASRSGSNGSSPESQGAAIRGRGGYRAQPPRELETRPANVTTTVGEGGTEVALLCNFFQLLAPDDCVVQDYHVSFEPQVEVARLRRQMVESLAGEFDRQYIFDGGSNLKALKRIERTEPFVVKHPDGSDVKIKFKFTQEIGWGALEMVRLYNTQMRRNLFNLGLLLMGRNYFDPKAKESLRDQRYQVELWPGFATAINWHESNLLCSVDFVTKIVRGETALTILLDLRRRFGAEWENEARKTLVSAIVMTNYNNKTYKIDDIDISSNPETYTFDHRGRQINLVTYYRERYTINLTQPRQPLLTVMPSRRDQRAGRTQPIILIPELCVMTGMTDEMRGDFNFTKVVQDKARLVPNERCKKLMEFIRRHNQNAKVQEEMGRFRMRLDDNLVQVSGRVLDPEKIYMANDTDTSASPYNQRSGDFSKEMRSKRLPLAPSYTRWVVIHTARDTQAVNEFLSTLERVSKPMGITAVKPKTLALNSDRVHDFVNAVKEIPQGCEFVVIVVPNNSKDRYDAIKKVLCCESGIPSQVIVTKTILNKQRLMSVTTKIAIQMAVKFGGIAWTLKIPPRDLMVVGYDSYHDSNQKKRSAGAFVCSLNQSLSSWFSRVAFHTEKEEMSSRFAANLSAGFAAYLRKNNSLPKRLIIYRDGVGDGDIPHVYNFELEQIKTAIRQVLPEGAASIALTFIIVTKRIAARFFEKIGPQNTQNPCPGTVIDRMVTRSIRFDFYLISQSVRQGTVGPCMFNIIFDESGWRPQHHQQLAYKLTHLYFNWPGTIKVPACCQYAHKLAYLTGVHLHQEPHPNLSDLPFYL